MKNEKYNSFVKKTETLVNPKDVTPISFLGDFNQLLNKKTQDKIMHKGSEKIPYMGFIVDPYCIFLSYEIKDTKKAEEMLPDGYELINSALYDNEEKKPIIIVCAFYARTSAFIGSRLEFYIIARNKETGLTSWIISDYETDTNSHDPKNGFCGYTSDTTYFTTTPFGELLVNFENIDKGRKFTLEADINEGEFRALYDNLWVEGNLSVDYGGYLKDESSKNFTLIFDPVLMKEAKNIPIDKIKIDSSSRFGDIVDLRNPLSCAIFPYSQHFIIKQTLPQNEINSGGQLSEYIDEFLNKKEMKTMAGDDLKKPIFRGMIISSIINTGIIIGLILKILL